MQSTEMNLNYTAYEIYMKCVKCVYKMLCKF